MMPPLPSLGFGLGLRASHMPYIFEHHPPVDWFEIISENYMDTGGKPRRNLARIRENYPIVMHGVSLSIGTVDIPESSPSANRREYLRSLKRLVDELNPAIVSDHLCWTGVAHTTTHDLLPLPYTEESLAHIIRRIKDVQDYLGRAIALENPSTYLEFQTSSMAESEFIARMVEASGCQLLLDVNNLYVTCYNHRLDPRRYLSHMPLDRVVQVHLSGHRNKGTHIIDTHDDHVVDEVWQLYRHLVQAMGYAPNTMIEWDDNIPPFPTLLSELEKARAVAAAALAEPLPPPAMAAPEPILVADPIPLLQQQQELQQAILAEAHPNPDAWIRDKQGFPPHAQLEVYRNAYRWRLFDVVAEDYPALKAYLGDAAFEALLKDFIAHTPPDHFNIARYAAALPDFQQIHAHAHAHGDGVAHGLCQLETAIAQLADAEETQPLTLGDLADITPDQLLKQHLMLRKALKLFAFDHDVNEAYRALRDGASIMPVVSPSWLVVFRHDDVVWRMPLEAAEYQLLQQILSGCALGEALENIPTPTEAQITTWFSRWMRHGMLQQPMEA